MASLGADLLLLAWVAISILWPGCAICHRWTQLRGIELFVYGAGVGIVLQAFLGLALTASRGARYPVVIVGVLATLAAGAYLWRSGAARAWWRDLRLSLRLSLALWVLFAATCVAVTHLAVRLPAELPDGRYIFKENTLNVRIQYLTTLPADNLIPYLVTEYFLRRISFRQEHPILPGQEVGNRTILMSLVALPYRAALEMPRRGPRPLGTFRYVQAEWPDVAKIYRDDLYRQVLVVGIFLNSLLLPGLLAVFSRVARASRILPCAAVLYLTNPYLITQTIFIWPKALAGFFLLLAWHSVRRRHHPAVVGAGAALACHAHPLAGMFTLGLGLFYLAQVGRGRGGGREVVIFGGSVGLLLAPWFLWTQLFLQLPSDLLWQNVAGPGTEVALASTLDFIWVRFWNFFHLLAPMMFFVYPFNTEAVVEAFQHCLPGAVGLILIGPALVQAARSVRPGALKWCALLGPLVVLVVIFSMQALPILHGYQVAVGGLLFFGVVALARGCSSRVFWSLCALQLLVNVGVLALRAYDRGWHIP